MFKKWFLGGALVVPALMAGPVLEASAQEPKLEQGRPGQMRRLERFQNQLREKLPPNTQFLYRMPGGEQDTIQFFMTGEGPKYGLMLDEVSEVLRAQLDLPEKGGLVVLSVEDGSPAAKAGVKKNDILLKAGEKAVESPEDLIKVLEDADDELVTLELVRGGKPVTVEMPSVSEETTETSTYYIGVQIGALDEAAREQLDLEEAEGGLVVLEVTPESPAAKAGLEKSDVLIEFNGKAVTDAQQLIELVKATEGKTVELVYLRKGDEKRVEITPEKRTLDVTWQAVPNQPNEFFFYGPGVMVDPNTGRGGGQQFRYRLAPGPGGMVPGQPMMPGAPGQPGMRIPFQFGPTDELQKSIEELKKEVERLQKDVETLKKGKEKS